MKKIIATAIITSLMSMVTIPAMAAPQHGHSHSKQAKKHHSHSQKSHTKYKPYTNKYPPQHKQKAVPKKIQSHQHWQRGQVLNKNYRSKVYWADAKQRRHLPKPGKNQRWMKVNQDYILINTLNNVIFSVLMR